MRCYLVCRSRHSHERRGHIEPREASLSLFVRDCSRRSRCPPIPDKGESDWEMLSDY